MFRARWLWCAFFVGLIAAPSLAQARAMNVDIWTDRGKDAIYEPNEPIEIKVRSSEDAYLLVYDIDSEGSVRVLYPYEGSTGYIAGGRNYLVPPASSGLQLVVQGPVGEGYIVAVASREPFNALPRYLRPYDPQAESAGYVGEDEEDDDSGVTSDGRITGDPFVAMERIRRQVLYDNENAETFGTAYTTYYIHEAVRYPRYLCNDCHRPGYWAWWDDWDPYYTTCSAFDFRVYWGWSWGPRYWFGDVPYFCYVPRCYPCAPYDRPYYSSWGGWREWRGIWGGPLVRYKTPPPAGYVPPGHDSWRSWSGQKPLPPGYLGSEKIRRGDGREVRVPVATRGSGGSPGQIGAGGSRGPGGDGQRDPGQGSIRSRVDQQTRRLDRPQVGNTPGSGYSGQGSIRSRVDQQTRRLDRPQVRNTPGSGYTRSGRGAYGGYGQSQPGGRVSTPRFTPGGNRVSPGRQYSAPSRQSSPAPSRQSSSAPARVERSSEGSRSAPSSGGSSRQSAPSSGNSGGGGPGGDRPGRR